MSQPLLARLAARGERLTVGALPSVAPVYRAVPEALTVLEWPFAHGRLDATTRWRTAGRLRGRFDTSYVLPNSLKAALIPWLAGIPRRVGYLGEGRRWLLNERLANPPGRPPMVAFYSALAEMLPQLVPTCAVPAGAAGAPTGTAGTPAADGDRPRLVLPAATVDAAARAVGIRAGRYWAFAPGAEYGPAKRWPPAHYAALARSLFAAHGDPVLLLGSAKERPLCDAIAAAAGAGCRVLAGAVPMLDAMALIAGARGVVTNDSGLMHVAAAFGVPQVGVFGSTSPRHTPPANPRARVLWLKDELQLDCMPCFARACRYGHTACLTGVRPERVEAALADALAAP